MATNLLSLPTLPIAFEVATNESWRDAIAFVVAGSVASYPSLTNTGRGNVTNAAVVPGAYIGNYSLVMDDPGSYRFADPSGNVIGAGTLGVPFAAGGMSFTLDYGSAAFVAGDTYTFLVSAAPLDITGIRFVMQMRSFPTSAQILVQGDTADGTIANGGKSGVLGLAIPASVMAKVPASPEDAPYVLDILALADGDQRRCVEGTCVVDAAITYPVTS